MSIFTHPLFTQVTNNLALFLLALFLASLIQKGFFWKFFRVKMSFGRLILVKIRATNRDYFVVGEVIDNFLVHKTKTGARRLVIPGASIFYKVMGTNWCDYDEKTSAFAMPDFSTVAGFDAEAYDNLYKRTLYRPTENDMWKRTVIILVITAVLVGAIAGFIAFLDYQASQTLLLRIDEVKSMGIVVPK